MESIVSRRRFLKTSATAGLTFAASGLALPAISRAQARPEITHGVQSGDVDATSGMIWARSDRPSRMMIEVATSDSFRDSRQLPPLSALPESDHAVKLLLQYLPSDQDIFYRVRFADLDDLKAVSEPVVGHFRTAPTSPQHPLGLVRRYRRPRLGHRRGWRGDEHLRRHGKPSA
jgi:alkaline phosphatase D